MCDDASDSSELWAKIVISFIRSDRFKNGRFADGESKLLGNRIKTVQSCT